MEEKEELERQKRLDRVFEYSTYGTCVAILLSLLFPAFVPINKLVVGSLCVVAIIHAFINYRILPPSHKGFISWDFKQKQFTLFLLDAAFVSTGMIFSGGIKSPYFFILFLPLITSSIILPTTYISIEVIAGFLGYLFVRFYTVGFWPIFDQSFFFAFTSLALVAYMASSVGAEERKARQKAQFLANQLREANVKLRELDRMKDDFLAIASHELRTPMAAIKGFISLVLGGGAGKVEPQAKEYLMQAYQGNERLIKLITDLLSVSRIESGRAEYMTMDFDPQEIVEDVIGELESEARRKGLFLRQQRLPSKVYVKGDPEKLKEVFHNLLSNGIKFTDRGGVEVTYEVSDSHLTVRVKDTGEGIDEKGQDLVFKKFQQVGPLLRRHPGGTGLGLYISRQYIEGMGGRIWLEKSEVGKGSTFAIFLPCQHAGDLSNLGEPVKMGEKERKFFLTDQKAH